ncbi:MAG: nickel pincer cofactor biosynthesis protein LarB [Thermoplasmata archaeon]
MARRSGPVRSARSATLKVGGYARIDRERPRRVGVPEIILGEGKTVDHLMGIIQALHAHRTGALISRPTGAQRRAIRATARAGVPLRLLAGGRVARLAGPLGVRLPRPRVAVLAAGTSDVAVAEEARAILEAFGVAVLTAYDVGVAGIHRLTRALARIETRAPRAYLVFAGREGALPTVVAGLVRAPVLGIPTSIGYGRGARGEAALTAMLQSCAPLAVVNIDAAVPAALYVTQWLLPDRSSIRPPPRGRRGREGVL